MRIFLNGSSVINNETKAKLDETLLLPPSLFIPLTGGGPDGAAHAWVRLDPPLPFSPRPHRISFSSSFKWLLRVTIALYY